MLQIRSIFRIAEFAGGYDSYLATHEGYLYLLDALPLFLAMSLYVFVWPPRFIPDVEYEGGLAALQVSPMRRGDMELGAGKYESGSLAQGKY
jgi:hypothetical protein